MCGTVRRCSKSKENSGAIPSFSETSGEAAAKAIDNMNCQNMELESLFHQGVMYYLEMRFEIGNCWTTFSQMDAEIY